MEEQTKTVEKKTFLMKVKEKTTDLVAHLIVYLSDNPGAMITLLGIFGQFAGACATVYVANSNKRKKCFLSKDEITGEMYKLKHELSNEEIKELCSRMIDGDTKGEALELMGLLEDKRKK